MPCLCLPMYFRYSLKTLLYSKRTYIYVYIGNLFSPGIPFFEEGDFHFLSKSSIKCYIVHWTKCPLYVNTM